MFADGLRIVMIFGRFYHVTSFGHIELHGDGVDDDDGMHLGQRIV